MVPLPIPLPRDREEANPFRLVNGIATSFLQGLINHPCQTGSVEPVHAEWTPLHKSKWTDNET